MIKLKHQVSKEEVTVSEGFSLWYLLMGPLLPLFQGMALYAVKALAKEAFTLGLARFYIGFVYNKHMVLRRLSEGYVPVTASDAKKVEALNIGYRAPELSDRIQKVA